MDTTQTQQPVTFSDVQVGDILRFVRIYRGFMYPGGEQKILTETVARVTAKMVTFESGVRLTAAKWYEADVRRGA